EYFCCSYTTSRILLF
nr:immunoglobulin light chain junction region [Macaca mulatta]